MASIRQELESTRTARWYRMARDGKWERDWSARMRLYAALSAMLAEQRAPHQPGTRRTQPPIQARSVLTEVARRANFAAESVYKRWRAREGQITPRWAGPSAVVRPAEAFVSEAKIVTFWPYREGVLQVADAFDMSVTEVAAGYLRALAAWAADDPCLAACVPGGPPGCVAEDMACLAGRIRNPAGPASPWARAARLTELAGQVVSSVLEDLSITPLGACNTVREEMLLLLSPQSVPVTDRFSGAVAEFSDLLMHRGAHETVLTPGQARQLLTELNELSRLLSVLPGFGQDAEQADEESQ